jgi:hypothetical protein
VEDYNWKVGSRRKIFHFSFDIFHLSFGTEILLTMEMTDEMRNGKSSPASYFWIKIELSVGSINGGDDFCHVLVKIVFPYVYTQRLPQSKENVAEVIAQLEEPCFLTV